MAVYQAPPTYLWVAFQDTESGHPAYIRCRILQTSAVMHKDLVRFEELQSLKCDYLVNQSHEVLSTPTYPKAANTTRAIRHSKLFQAFSHPAVLGCQSTAATTSCLHQSSSWLAMGFSGHRTLLPPGRSTSLAHINSPYLVDLPQKRRVNAQLCHSSVKVAMGVEPLYRLRQLLELLIRWLRQHPKTLLILSLKKGH